MTNNELLVKIKETCNLIDYDRVYLPTEMRVNNGWNASLIGFYNNGDVIIRVATDTDWDDNVTLGTLMRDGFCLHTRGVSCSFSKSDCDKFIANFCDYYKQQTEPKQKELHMLHKEHDKQMRMDFNSVVNDWYGRLRLDYVPTHMSSPKRDRYHRIEKALSADWKENFAELCKLTPTERVARWKGIAGKVE